MSAATNSTGEYLKLHADMETEELRSPQPHLNRPPAISAEAFEAALDTVVRGIQLGPNSTVEDIARLCAMFSTPGREVYARIECVDRKPVAYLVRGDDKHFLPAFLRRQAG